MNEKSIEVEGMTTKEAIQKALKLLGATKDKMDRKSVCEGGKGLWVM